MAIDGADFIEIYRYFVDKGISRNQAFENSRRVFRGGVLVESILYKRPGIFRWFY